MVVLLMPSEPSRFPIDVMLQNCCALMATQHETSKQHAHVIVRDER
jgi:hypothetical protein